VDVADAEAAVARIERTVRGTLRVSAPTIFGERHVAPLLAAHPDLRVEAVRK
jgi:DNA-binding transcriptional LysR family regulator